MTRCLAIACLVAALAGAAAPAPVPAAGLPDQPILLADPVPPGGEPPDPGDPPPSPEHPPAGEGSNADDHSGMTCC